MRFARIVFAAYIICLSALPDNAFAQNSRLHLQIAGDAQQGFYVNIYEGNRLQVTRTEELSIKLFNLDLSTTASIESWKGEKWSGNDTAITLSRTSYIKEFDANLNISVRYEVIHQHIVKKTIRLFQPSMPDMYYILEETARPAGIPVRYSSFEHDDFPGGFVHEMFPAVGWITPGQQLVGFLTDAGYKNQYTRTTRRRFSGRGGGFVGMRKLPDPELFSVATAAERNQQDNYIRQTYGEMYNLDAGTTTLLKLPAQFQKEGNTEVEKTDSLISLNLPPRQQVGNILFPSTQRSAGIHDFFPLQRLRPGCA